MIDDDAWHGVEADHSKMKAAHGLRIHIRVFIPDNPCLHVLHPQTERNSLFPDNVKCL